MPIPEATFEDRVRGITDIVNTIPSTYPEDPFRAVFEVSKAVESAKDVLTRVADLLEQLHKRLGKLEGR